MWKISLLFLMLVSSTMSLRNMALHQNATQSSQLTFNPYSTADKAVDGNRYNTVYNISSCTHTALNQKTVWWQVDMGQAVRIDHIYLVYRSGYQNRLAGFSIFASKSPGDWIDGHGFCYKHTGSSLPPTTMYIHTCKRTARYVTMYNTRGGNDPSTYSDNAIIELCEMEVYGCPEFRYGAYCNMTCHCNGCNPRTGKCDSPTCHSGWKGEQCSDVCDPKTFGDQCGHECFCKNGSCHHITGICEVQGCQHGWSGMNCTTACVNNTFGPDCKNVCYCLNGGCDRFNGTCLESPGVCQPGWRGKSCNEDCPEYKYGVNCAEQCHCYCHSRTGKCVSPTCHSGWKGEQCDVACANNTFGTNCADTCHCLHGGCDRFNGSCIDSQGLCKPGWTRESCSEVCDSRTFGDQCKNQCHCKTGNCHRITGVCEIPGCQQGWYGVDCTKACVNNTFGADCAETCHCLKGGCDRLKGTCSESQGLCQPGWTKQSCSEVCPFQDFGDQCKYKCFCKAGNCHHITGVCDNQGCQHGWMGLNCTTACVNNTFGPDCAHTCHCLEDECERFNGKCSQFPGVCQAGWTEQNCSQVCKNDTFGENCTGICGTCNGTAACNHITGICENRCEVGFREPYCNECNQGIYGDNCDKICGDCPESAEHNCLVNSIILGSGCGILMISQIVTCLLLIRLRRASSGNTEKKDNTKSAPRRSTEKKDNTKSASRRNTEKKDKSKSAPRRNAEKKDYNKPGNVYLATTYGDDKRSYEKMNRDSEEHYAEPNDYVN